MTQSLEERDQEIVEKLQNPELSLADIADMYGLSRERIRQIGDEHNVTSVRPPPQSEYVDEDGISYKYQPDHPRADDGKGRKGYVRWAVLNLEGKIGRHLEEDEYVIHLNGDKTDDDPNNLEVVGRDEWYEHMGQQARKYDNEAALMALRFLAIELGRTPTVDDVNGSTINAGIYYRYFGSLSEAVEEANLHPNTVGFGGPKDLPDGYEDKWSYLTDQYDNAKEVIENE